MAPPRYPAGRASTGALAAPIGPAATPDATAARHRAARSQVGQRSRRSRPGLSGRSGRSGLERGAARRRRRRAAGATGSPGARPRRRSRPRTRPSRPAGRGGSDGRCGGRSAARPPRPGRRTAGLGGDVGRHGPRAAPTSSCRPTGSTPGGRARRTQGERVGAVGRANHRAAGGRGRVRRITSPRSASVPSEPTSSRHRSKPLTFFTVGPPAFTTSPSADTTPRLQQRVAHRPVAEAPDAAAADGQHAADRRPRPVGRATHWPVLGQRGVAARPRACRPAAARSSPPASTHIDARRAPRPRRGARHRPAADVPLACGRPRRSTGARRRRRSARERPLRPTRRPAPRWRSPQRLPAGQHLVRVGHAVGIERLAQAGLGVEVGRGEQQRHEVALLEPDAVLARQHAAGRDADPHDLLAGGVHPLEHARARARRTRAAGGGCRRRRGTRSSRSARGGRRSRRPCAAPRPAACGARRCRAGSSSA